MMQVTLTKGGVSLKDSMLHRWLPANINMVTVWPPCSLSASNDVVKDQLSGEQTDNFTRE